MTPEPTCPFPHGSFHRPIALETPRCMCAALRAAEAEGRAAALEDAARRCELLAHRPRGNDYGNIGNAYDECAFEIRSLLNQGRDEVALNSPDFSGPSREEK